MIQFSASGSCVYSNCLVRRVGKTFFMHYTVTTYQVSGPIFFSTSISYVFFVVFNSIFNFYDKLSYYVGVGRNLRNNSDELKLFATYFLFQFCEVY